MSTRAQSYFQSLARIVTEIDGEAVDRLTAQIRTTRDAGGMIYTLGNGGSASTASHMALDLAKNTRRPDRPNLRIFALTDNAAALTAWANDARYEDVFSAQLLAVVRPEDLVIAISASGNSANVLESVRVANRAGAFTFGITGHEGGKLVHEARDCVIVPSDNVQHIEDGHLAIMHAVTNALFVDG